MSEPIQLVDWPLATATAIRLAPRGPAVTRDQAHEAVRELRELAAQAEEHVAAFTGLSAPHPHDPAHVVDRGGWVRSNVGGFQVVLQPLLDKLAAKRADQLAGPLVARVGSRVTGVQLGVVLAYLSGKVLGQYELFLPASAKTTADRGRLTLVAPNVVAAERGLGVDPHDFRLWVCVHEVTHRTQFTAVPWLRAHVQGEISAFLLASELDAAALLGRLRAAGDAVSARLRPGSRTDGEPPLGLVDLVQTPDQRAIFARLTAVMTLLEGHGEYVMNAIGTEVIPSVEQIGRRFGERRRGQSPADRLVRRLFGLEMKARQYAEGAAFVRAVVEQAGMASFNRVWTSPNTLPTSAEIAEPDRWMSRVLRSSTTGG